MRLEIKNFEKALEGQHFDKWNVFEPYDTIETYSFKARNKPHSEKHEIDCIAVLIEISRNEDIEGFYQVKMCYETYTNSIYSKGHTKKEISNRTLFFNMLTNIINQYEKHK